jgi:hypothetical protein
MGIVVLMVCSFLFRSTLLYDLGGGMGYEIVRNNAPGKLSSTN